MAGGEQGPAEAVGEIGPLPDPLSMLQAAGDLLDPVAAARQMPWLAGELAKIAAGRADQEPARDDPRFADVTWRDNPFFRVLAQSYRVFGEWAGRMADAAEGHWERQARARYLAGAVTAALAPTNFLATNPAALKRAFETGGASLLRGAQNMARDMAAGGMPRMARRDPFPVGEKLARTPGAVVYRDEIFELLQYAPATPMVCARPLLMVPPEVNRYYVLDLAPGRSMAEYAVGQGVQTFMIVWRNPRAGLGHGRWGLDDYVAAGERAAGIVQAIIGSDTVNWLGLCAGGITAALILGYLAARGEAPPGAATYLVTMLNSAAPSIAGMIGAPDAQHLLEQAAEAGQVIPGPVLRAAFAWLRPDDLVFSYLVSGWLMGEEPSAFDILAWNDDATAVAARFAAEATALLVGHKAVRPGGLTVLGTPVDLARVDGDSFHVAGYTDHIVPWQAAYACSQVLGGDKEMVLARSGHIQSFVNPARTGKYGYWSGPPAGPEPDAWLAAAAAHDGSWWPHWAQWLIPRSGPEKEPPRSPGIRKYPPLGPAPGRYVHE